ncbi:MAG: hypothetical protein ACFFCD_07005 [Promethearchaeota archaeon]
MAKQLETPCAAPTRGLPFELRYDYMLGGWITGARGFLYMLRDKYGPAETLKIFERVYTMDDRVKILANTIRTVFNLQGNDCKTIGEVFDIWDEITGIESTILERSPTINRRKVTKCPWKTEPKDVSDWFLPFFNTITETINSKATLERPKAMCAGDPYCECVWKLEESTLIEGSEDAITKKLETPCAAPKKGIPWGQKYDFVMRNCADDFKRRLYAIREKYGPAAAVEIYAMQCKEGDRIKNMTNALLKVFNLQGTDCVTIGEVLDVWDELCGYESFILERSPTINRRKVTKCPWKVDYKDIGEYAFAMKDVMGKTVNPKATLEVPKKMCTGDPYCDYIWRIEE